MEPKAKPTWIWYPGDFEVWLGNRFNSRRTERGAMFPPFWKHDSHWPMVTFAKTVDIDSDETLTVEAEGRFNFSVDGRLQSALVVPKGRHELSFKVWNQSAPPALFVSGATIVTDASWQVTFEDKVWIDECGVAHGAGTYVPAGSWTFDSADTPPSHYRLACREERPAQVERLLNGGLLVDFGRETFGYLCLKVNCSAGTQCALAIYYGESREEALDAAHCETLDRVVADQLLASPVVRLDSKAFRYVSIEMEGGVDVDDVWMDYEYSPFDPARSGSFGCSDEELNHIWQVAAYTLDLTTREFFVDGIKRDRWTWSGDAIQSYLMNYYLRFDNECVKRTIRQLRGKDPVTSHVNTIMDYSFYWVQSVMDYYLYTGDKHFLREIYAKMVTLMDYVLSRTDASGMASAQPDDWIFVDWTDFPMHKRGALCFEQILLYKSLQTMAQCTALIDMPVGYGKARDSRELLDTYSDLAGRLAKRINGTFWSQQAGAYFHGLADGMIDRQVTKFPNMFAILYGLASKEQAERIMSSVMLNPDVPAITTPYMRFYELETLCMMGLQEEVLQQMKDYWGGMLRLGATTFWEKYNPLEQGREHLAMYGRPYGKSLCHAWGASPIYLLGRYFLGVQPTMPGYSDFTVRPTLGGLQWMRGAVPTPYGFIRVSMDNHEVRVSSDGGYGTLIVGGKRYAVKAGEEVRVEL